MTDQERELDLALAEAMQENRKLREENKELQHTLYVERTVIREMGDVLSNYEDLMVEMKQRITELEGT
jgi:hypothetical protein